MEQQIKDALKILMKDTKYAKANILDQRIDMLFKIHKSWIIFAQVLLTPQEMAQKLFTYDKNLG